MLDVLGVLQMQFLVRTVNHVRLAEASYTLQRGRLCRRRRLVLPVELLGMVVKRDL